jgi:hypothetical protein
MPGTSEAHANDLPRPPICHGSSLWSVFPRRSQYARDRQLISQCLHADLTVECIGDLLDYDLVMLLASQQSVQITREVTR